MPRHGHTVGNVFDYYDEADYAYFLPYEGGFLGIPDRIDITTENVGGWLFYSDDRPITKGKLRGLSNIDRNNTEVDARDQDVNVVTICYLKGNYNRKDAVALGLTDSINKSTLKGG